MICTNGFCPSGIKTPKKCPALGFCDRGIPAKTVEEVLQDREILIDLLYSITERHDEPPWYKWACPRCEANNGLPCEDLGECVYKGSERALIDAWLKSPERVWDRE